jgi:hypothetical protein
MHFLEVVCMPFLDRLATVNRPCVRHQNRVIRVERGQGGGIVLIVCVVKFFGERDNLLTYLWIWRVSGWNEASAIMVRL